MVRDTRRRASPGPNQHLRRHNLPTPATRLVGRDAELASVGKLLDGGSRLVTLTGPGGCGKTRLALQVAREYAETFGDGVRWVELAAIQDDKLIAQTVASVTGVREQRHQSLVQALVNYFSERSMLLVLDNCEHLVAGCAALV